LHCFSVYTRLALLSAQYLIICKRVEWDRQPYTDLAIKPVDDLQLDELDIFIETTGGMDTLNTARRKAAVREAKVAQA